jgi:signal transduction histidine kinase
VVFVDQTRLAQVLSNLISNGCKFTPLGGQVTVRMATRHAPPALLEPLGRASGAAWAAAQGVVRFSVTDSGPGVALDAQARLFQQFHDLRDHAQQEPAAGNFEAASDATPANGNEAERAASTGIGLWCHFTAPKRHL